MKSFKQTALTAASWIDRFQFGVSFRTGGQERLTTCFGTLLSLLALIIVLIHGNNKFLVMKDLADTKYQSI